MTGPNRCAQPTNLNHDEEDVDLFTSLRYDPQLLRSKKNSALAANKTAGSSLYMLQYHRDRISAAAKHFGWEAAVSRLADLTAFESYLLQEVETFREANGRLPDQPLRVRVVCTRTGTLSTTLSTTPPVPLASLYPLSLSPSPVVPPRPPWTFHLDDMPTSSTAFTRFKTTSRGMYEAARERVSIPSFTTPAEVFMYGENDEMTEGSLTSVYFLRDGRWVTPPVDSGGQAGTTRRWALGEGMCQEAVVRKEDVREGEEAWVSNGVRGFIQGKVILGAFREDGKS